MKKKLIALLTICILMFSLAGCKSTTYEEATKESYEDYGGGYFTVIKEWGTGNGTGYTYRIVYANDTRVKYLIVTYSYQYGITPLYNADGTLQIYDGE